MFSKSLVSVIAFAALGTVTTQAQVPGEALTTAQAQINIVPAVPIQPEPKMTPEAFGALISCQSVYQGGLEDAAVTRCIAGQGAKGASE
jgi:hypothetical protein